MKEKSSFFINLVTLVIAAAMCLIWGLSPGPDAECPALGHFLGCGTLSR